MTDEERAESIYAAMVRLVENSLPGPLPRHISLYQEQVRLLEHDGRHYVRRGTNGWQAFVYINTGTLIVLPIKVIQ